MPDSARPRLPAVAQPRRQAVDRQVDRPPRALVGLAGAEARAGARPAGGSADRGRESGCGCCARASGCRRAAASWPVIASERRERARVLVGDAREDRARAARRRAPAPRSATRRRGRSSRAPSPCSTSTLAEERPALVHLAQQRRAASAPRSRATPRSRCPTPYQPGSISRHWLQLNTHGIARRSSMRVDAVRDAGRLPMLSCGDLGDRRRRAEVVDEARRPVDERAVRVERVRGELVHRARSRRPRDRRAARRRAARPRARRRRASRGCAGRASASEYLLAMISPCSVIRSPALDAARGCARIAS